MGGNISLLPPPRRCAASSWIERVAGWDTPYPHAEEWDYFLGPARVGRALIKAMEG